MARAIVVGPFPPPVTGLGAVTQRMAELLAEGAEVTRISTSPGTLTRGPAYHARRMLRVLLAALSLLRSSGPGTPVLIACDAGFGMYYTAVLALLSRMRKPRIYIQHHSYAYVLRRQRRMVVLRALAGRRAVHLVSCPRMASDLTTTYPGLRTEVLSVAVAIDPVVSDRANRQDKPALRVGLLGNLTEAKGVSRAFETARQARELGVMVELLLAGPVVSPEDQTVLDRLLASDPHARHIGPVYGADRDDFLAGLDVALFPSTYVHESFVLAAWEAMGHGCPIVAFEAGCLTQSAIGAAGIVLGPGTDFPARAARQLADWNGDRAALEAAATAAGEIAGITVTQAHSEAHAFALRVVDEQRR